MSKKTLLISVFAFTMLLTGCGGSGGTQGENSRYESGSNITENRNSGVSNSSSDDKDSKASADQSGEENSYPIPAESASELEVCFGDGGEPFILHLYDNDTAAAIAKHVGTSDWRLPIYHYDDFENWEVMQYYDIPSRYEIPSDPETVTSEKAGEVYYSEPNRIILFYGDAEVSSEYTKVGYFDFTEELKQAVENNPVLEGWGNKIVIIQIFNQTVDNTV